MEAMRRRVTGLAILGLALSATAGAAPAQSSWSFADIGQVLGASDLGRVPGPTAGVADPTAVRLPDGGIRLYFDRRGAIGSAVSGDGVRFAVESGARLTGTGPHTRIVRLADGRYRLYFNVTSAGGPDGVPRELGIGSAISSDGLRFTVEPGLRVGAAPAGVSAPATLSPGDVVRLRDGGYRMYFSSLSVPLVRERREVVKSATSRDGFTWTIDPGVRIGPGAHALSGSAEHPSALVRADGSVVLVYGRADPVGLYVSTSRDGLTFATESALAPGALDSALLASAGRTLLVYYGHFTPSGGGTIRVGKLTPPASSQPPKKPVPKCKKGQKPTKQKPCRK